MMDMLLSSDRFPSAFNAGFYQNPKVDELLGVNLLGDEPRDALAPRLG